MLPSEVVNVWGKAITKKITFPTPDPVNIPAAPDRYAITFFSCTFDVSVFPEENSNLEFPPWVFNSTTLPKTFHVDHDGAIPMMGFTLIPSAVPNTLVVIESYAWPRGARRSKIPDRVIELRVYRRR